MLICPSHVVSVQVYANGARITREVYPSHKGHDLVWAVKDLDDELDPHSIFIQVYDGHEFSRYSWYTPTSLSPQRSSSSIDQLEKQLLERKEEIFQELRQTFLETNLDQAFSLKGVHLTEDYQDEFHRHLVRLEQHLKINQDTLEYVYQKSEDVEKNQDQGKHSRYLRLHFKSHRLPHQPILISYFTPRVSWRPRYHLLTSPKETQAVLKVGVEIQQWTHEDWIDVSLSVCSGFDPLQKYSQMTLPSQASQQDSAIHQALPSELEASKSSHKDHPSSAAYQSGFWRSLAQTKADIYPTHSTSLQTTSSSQPNQQPIQRFSSSELNPYTQSASVPWRWLHELCLTEVRLNHPSEPILYSSSQHLKRELHPHEYCDSWVNWEGKHAPYSIPRSTESTYVTLFDLSCESELGLYVSSGQQQGMRVLRLENPQLSLPTGPIEIHLDQNTTLNQVWSQPSPTQPSSLFFLLDYEPCLRIKRETQFTQEDDQYLYQEIFSVYSTLPFDLPLYLESIPPVFEHSPSIIPWDMHQIVEQGNNSWNSHSVSDSDSLAWLEMRKGIQPSLDSTLQPHQPSISTLSAPSHLNLWHTHLHSQVIHSLSIQYAVPCQFFSVE